MDDGFNRVLKRIALEVDTCTDLIRHRDTNEVFSPSGG
jgi:hypothetical protein